MDDALAVFKARSTQIRKRKRGPEVALQGMRSHQFNFCFPHVRTILSVQTITHLQSYPVLSCLHGGGFRCRASAQRCQCESQQTAFTGLHCPGRVQIRVSMDGPVMAHFKALTFWPSQHQRVLHSGMQSFKQSISFPSCWCRLICSYHCQ